MNAVGVSGGSPFTDHRIGIPQQATVSLDDISIALGLA
jgi:hypothetical protein